jgi:hypothetical protein
MLRMRRGENSIVVPLASRTRLRVQSAKADFGPLLPRLQSPQPGRGLGFRDRCGARDEKWPRLDPSAREVPGTGK